MFDPVEMRREEKLLLGMPLQRRRMIDRPCCRLQLNAAKAEPGQIKLIDKNIDRPDRIILEQLVLQSLGNDVL